MEEETKQQRLSRVQVYDIVTQMRGVVTVHEPQEEGAEKKCEYHDGWSDAKFAEQFACSKSSIAEIRREFFGRLYETPTVNAGRGAHLPTYNTIKRLEAKNKELEIQVAQLQAIIVNLESRLADLEAAVTKPERAAVLPFPHTTNGTF